MAKLIRKQLERKPMSSSLGTWCYFQGKPTAEELQATEQLPHDEPDFSLRENMSEGVTRWLMSKKPTAEELKKHNRK